MLVVSCFLSETRRFRLQLFTFCEFLNKSGLKQKLFYGPSHEISAGTFKFQEFHNLCYVNVIFPVCFSFPVPLPSSSSVSLYFSFPVNSVSLGRNLFTQLGSSTRCSKKTIYRLLTLHNSSKLLLVINI